MPFINTSNAPLPQVGWKKLEKLTESSLVRSQSWLRRGAPTQSRAVGHPFAVHAGDAPEMRSPSPLPLPGTKDKLLTFPSQTILSQRNKPARPGPLPSGALIKAGNCSPALHRTDKPPLPARKHGWGQDFTVSPGGRAYRHAASMFALTHGQTPTHMAFKQGTQCPRFYLRGTSPPMAGGGGERAPRPPPRYAVLGNPTGRSGRLTVLLNRCGHFLSISIR